VVKIFSGKEARWEGGQVWREVALHSHLSILFDDLPAHGGQVLMLRDDADVCTGESEELVQRCVDLCFVFVDD
jgi:hypothetical protein